MNFQIANHLIIDKPAFPVSLDFSDLFGLCFICFYKVTLDLLVTIVEINFKFRHSYFLAKSGIGSCLKATILELLIWQKSEKHQKNSNHNSLQ